jgi:SAM-dependent methyltransferase
MHPSAMRNAKRFFDTYEHAFPDGAKVYDIGSQDVNGSMREVCPARFEYVGVDFVSGPGVDIVLDAPYDWRAQIDIESADIVVSSSCFEHSEFFWATFIEIMWILKPQGLMYLNAPANGPFHRYPVDCWRFYPDSGRALAAWARHYAGFASVMLESYTTAQEDGMWNDFVAVFLKDDAHLGDYPRRILSSHKMGCTNAQAHGREGIMRLCEIPEDQRRRVR